jgi:Fe2+ or Zn2+ uptake regulation protein
MSRSSAKAQGCGRFTSGLPQDRHRREERGCLESFTIPIYRDRVTNRASDAELLRASGLRATAGRLAILAALDETPHADAERLRRGLGPGTPSLQAVYNILADLHRAGLVRRFEPARSAARYERRVDDNHHHAVCSVCGKVVDVDCTVGVAPCLHGEVPAGFAVAAAEVIFWGVCDECAAAAG